MAAAGKAPAFAAECALDLSDPPSISIIVGRYDGRWIDDRSHRTGGLVVTFALNPSGGGKPFVRETRVLGSSTIDPNKPSRVSGEIEQNTLLFSYAYGWSRYRFYEENGQITARGEYRYETGPMARSGGTHALAKVRGGSGPSALKRP